MPAFGLWSVSGLAERGFRPQAPLLYKGFFDFCQFNTRTLAFRLLFLYTPRQLLVLFLFHTWVPTCLDLNHSSQGGQGAPLQTLPAFIAFMASIAFPAFLL